MPFDKSSRKAGQITYLTAIDYLKHSLSQKDLEYLYKQQVIGVDTKGRIILNAEEASLKVGEERRKLFNLVNREIIKRDWAGGIRFRIIKSSCESHPPYKELLFLPRDLVTMTLPHRRIDGSEYSREDGKRELILLAPQSIGLPYGVYARLILMFLTTERVRSKDRRFELKASWRTFLKKLQLPWHGARYHAIKDQLRRLCSTAYTIHTEDDSDEELTNIKVADQWFRSTDCFRISFSEDFYNMTARSVIPLEPDVVQKLKRSPLTLDLYAWLTYRTWKIKNESFIGWHKLQEQFGANYKRKRDFRAKFRLSLDAVLKQNPISPVSKFAKKDCCSHPAVQPIWNGLSAKSHVLSAPHDSLYEPNQPSLYQATLAQSGIVWSRFCWDSLVALLLG